MRRLKRTLSAGQKTHVSENDRTHDNEHDKKAAGRKAAKTPLSFAPAKETMQKTISQTMCRTMLHATPKTDPF